MIRKKRYHEAIPEATNEKEALTYAQAFRVDLLRGRLDLIEDYGSEKFETIVDDYILYAKNNLKSTDTVIPIAQSFKTLWGKKQIREITPNLIEKYKAERNNSIYYDKVVNGKRIIKTICPATVNRELGVLSKIFSIAIDNKKAKENPLLKIERLKVSNKLERHLTKEEQDRFIKFCNHDYSYMNVSERELEKITNRFCNYSYDHVRDVALISLNTGLRLNEVLNLTWDCVNLTKNVICALNTKNGESNSVPMNNVVHNILIERFNCKANNIYVFTNPETGTRYGNIHRAFTTACKMANIEHFRFHDTRHTFASRAIDKNVPVPVLQNILNHKNIKTTMRYVHTTFDQKLNAVNSLND
jgi:integrase